jgi:hypothetical protein
MEIQQLVERINARHQAHYRLHGRYAAGQNQGAFALVDPQGARFVLKLNQRPAWLKAIERARRITDHLRARGVPVPAYTLAGAFADGATYWLQTALPGAPPAQLTSAQLQQLFTYIDAQAGQAITPDQDWSTYVLDVVFRGESGWAASLADYGAATRGARAPHAACSRQKRDDLAQ